MFESAIIILKNPDSKIGGHNLSLLMELALRAKDNIISIAGFDKREICYKVGIGCASFSVIMHRLARKDYLRRISTGTYMLNPFMFLNYKQVMENMDDTDVLEKTLAFQTKYSELEKAEDKDGREQ